MTHPLDSDEIGDGPRLSSAAFCPSRPKQRFLTPFQAVEAGRIRHNLAVIENFKDRCRGFLRRLIRCLL
jgi:hypothetical protein